MERDRPFALGKLVLGKMKGGRAGGGRRGRGGEGGEGGEFNLGKRCWGNFRKWGRRMKRRKMKTSVNYGVN